MNNLEIIRGKILSADALQRELLKWRLLNKKIVFTNGCFDLLHPGHITYLAGAAGLGDVLIIGLNSDRSVRGLKGENRPLTDENSRALILASLHFVTAVVIFDEPTPLELITAIQPDVLVKGGDYKAEEVVGYEVVTGKGGKVKILGFVPGYSTTSIEEKILLKGK